MDQNQYSVSFSRDEAFLLRYILVRYRALLAYTADSWECPPNILISLAKKFSFLDDLTEE